MKVKSKPKLTGSPYSTSKKNTLVVLNLNDSDQFGMSTKQRNSYSPQNLEGNDFTFKQRTQIASKSNSRYAAEPSPKLADDSYGR